MNTFKGWMGVCGGCIDLCLGVLSPDYQTILVKKASLVVLVTEAPVAIPPGQPEAWGLLLSPKKSGGEEMCIPRPQRDWQTAGTMPSLLLSGCSLFFQE